MNLIIREHMKLLVKYWVLKGKFNQMKANNIGIQEENERLYAIIEDLKNGSVY